MKKLIHLSLIAMSAILFTLFTNGCQINKIRHHSFSYTSSKEDVNEMGTYLVKNDGEKIMGEHISWKSGIVTKNQIHIDEQKFKISEIKGYRVGATYYIRSNNSYIQRIVHGPRINIYVRFTYVIPSSTNPRPYTRTDHFAQKGEDGELIGFGGQKAIKKLVADCPLSYELANVSNSKMRKSIKNDANYLNRIFEIYNNNCKN